MTFNEALKKLHIEDYGDRIINSNSHGELFHLADYMWLADNLSEDKGEQFRVWFVAVVNWAEQTWSRPESVFQHMLRLVGESAQGRVQ